VARDRSQLLAREEWACLATIVTTRAPTSQGPRRGRPNLWNRTRSGGLASRWIA